MKTYKKYIWEKYFSKSVNKTGLTSVIVIEEDFT
jgi:hypothetical protein